MKLRTVQRRSYRRTFGLPPCLIGTGIVLAILLGCSKPDIVGEWETSESGKVFRFPATAQVHASIKSDGKYAITQDVPAREQQMMISQEEGTWDVRGDSITLASNSYLLNGIPKRENVHSKKTQKFRVNGDRLIIYADQNNTVTFHRVK